jgi:hypothetical protein
MKPPLDVPPVGPWQFRPNPASTSLGGTRALGARNPGSRGFSRLDYLLAAAQQRDRRLRRAALLPLPVAIAHTG